MTNEEMKKEWQDFTCPGGDETDVLRRNVWLLDRLKKPEGIVDAVLDTDTYNEIDEIGRAHV